MQIVTETDYKPVVYKPVKCPRCQSKKVPVQHSFKSCGRRIRSHACKRCGWRFKSVEE